MDQLNPLLFFHLFHAFVRTDSSPEEIGRTKRVFHWLGENIPIVLKVSETAQKNLWGVLWDHWMRHHSAASRSVIESLVRKLDKPDAMLDLLRDYDEFTPDLPKYDDFDIPALLEDRKEDWERAIIKDVLDRAQRINGGRIAGKTQKDPQLSGARDAVSYFLEQLQGGALIPEYSSLGGSVKDKSEQVYEAYVKNKQENKDDRLTIPTNLEAIDSIIGGIKRKTFWGVLGFSGQRKSAFCRTICYFAAMAGFHILHIPLESEADEEMSIYGIMHSHHNKFRNYGFKLEISRYSDGKFTPEEEAYLKNVVLPDMKASMLGDIVVRQPIDQRWPAIKAMIELEDRASPIDMVYIDYLTLIDVYSERNGTEAMNNIIREFKRMGLTFDNGRGFAVLTPVQGSRQGYDRAKENDGVWDKDGIGQFNEFEKSLDVLVYVYQDLALQADNLLKIGTCKSRRSADVQVTSVKVEPASGRVMSLKEEGSITLDSSLKDSTENNLRFC